MKNIFRKSYILPICLALIFCLSGCFPSGEVAPKISSDFNQGEIPSSMKDTLLDNLLIDAKVDVNGELGWKQFNVDYRELNYEQFLNELLKNKKILETDKDKAQVKNATKSIGYTFDDETFLYIDSDRLSYSSKLRYDDRSYSQVISGSTSFIRADMAEVYTKDKLDNLDKEQSIDLVRQQLITLGVEFYEEPMVYALDHETMMSEWEDYLMPDGTWEKKWSKDEEVYVIVFQEKMNDLPVTNTSYRDVVTGHDNYGGKIMGVVSKHGLINLKIESMFKATAEQNVDKLISFNSTLDLLKQKYKDIILPQPITISNVALELVPMKDIKDETKISLVPAYVFTANQKEIMQKEGFADEVFDVKFNIMFNAQTGQEIAIGMTL